MRHRLIILTLGLGMLLAGRIPAAAQGDGFPRRVTDDSGAAITIPARPARVAVVSEIPGLGLLLAPDERRDLDPANAAPDWGGAGLLVLPDLYAAAYPGLVAAAQAAGVPVFQVGAITGLEGWRSLVARLGQATGREDRAAAILARLDARQAAVAARVGDEPPTRVLILTPEGYTFGRGTLISDLVGAAGGVNVAADAGYDDFRQLDAGAIPALAPDVLLFSPAWDRAAIVALLDQPPFRDLPAVRHGRVFRLPFSPTLPPDPGAAVLILGLLLHPAALLLP